MSPAAAIALCAVLILGCIALIAVMARQHEAEYQARHAFADPRDVTDPDGERFVASLSVAGRLPELPPEPPPPAPADTGVLPFAVCEWGMTAEQKAGELAAKYLAAPAVKR